MSKKNFLHKKKKVSCYPLPSRTVLYSRKKDIQPIPEVGKKYHCFDDGKIRLSRHFIIQVDEVLNHMEFKKKYPEQFQQYIEQSKECYWLLSRRSDKFIITYKGENDELGVYVRTKQGGWFGCGNWFNSAKLDVTGECWQNMLNDMAKYKTYTPEEIENIIKENAI